MTLNSEGLEKAVRAYDDALNNPVFVECKKCQGTGYHHGFGETGHDPDWCLKCGGSKCVLANGEDTRPLRSAISAYLSATPVDGLEVVALDLTKRIEREFYSDQPGGAVQTRAKVQSIISETLSQASSVIAGLTAERDDAKASAFVWENRFVLMDGAYNRELSRAEAAEARIYSLEEENKRLEAELKKQMHRATNAEYMGRAYRSMLGEKGQQVAKAWDEKGVKRVHHSWGPDAAAMTGEERAQTLLDWEDALKTAVPVETVDGEDHNG